MSTWDRISEDIKTAMKARDKDRLSTLRMMLSELKYAKAAIGVNEELKEADAIKVVTTYQKRLVKSLDDYPDGEKRAAINQEIAIVNEYLPKKASAEDVGKVVDQVLKSTEDRNFGNLMKLVMAQLGDSGDGKIVSQVIKSKVQ